jgi:HPt (histidine-containing phosphotransfer) domain-containing protein
LLKYFKPLSWQSEDEAEALPAEDALQKKLIRNFLEDNRDKAGEIENALKAGDVQLAHRLAHTLKGNAGQLGKGLLQQAAAEIEALLKDGKNQVTQQQMARLETELRDVLAEFEQSASREEREEFEQKADAPAQALDKEAALSLLEELEPQLIMGKPECREYIGKLRRVPGSENLIRQMENLDFDPAIAILAELRLKIRRG